MKTFTKIILSLLFVFQFTQLSAWTSLRIQNPDNWDSQTGVIEEAVLTVRPHGIYLQYDMYLTFSAGEWQYEKGEQLEIQYFFDLPENAIVNDAWLWVGEDIMKAKIMSRWEAYQIYEEIVSRRKDPLIFYKNWGNSYELRIYPLLPDETRRIKISYLVPAIWTDQYVMGNLPTDLLMASAEIPDLKVRVFANNQFPRPAIKNHSEIEFKAIEISEPGNFTEAVIPKEQFDELLKIRFDAPLKNGVFFSAYNESAGEGYYQMVMMPSGTVGIDKDKKFMFVVNIEDTKYDLLHPEDITGYIYDFLANICTEDDYFNILITGKDNYLLSETWLTAELNNIEDAIARLEDFEFSTENLISGIIDAHEFMKDNQGEGELVVISNYRNYSEEPENANDYIKKIRDKAGSVYPINVVNYSYQIDWDMFYENEEKFYWFSNVLNQLAYQTYGKYYNLNQVYYYYDVRTTDEQIAPRINSKDVFTQLYETTGNVFALLDIYTTAENGVCYGRFNPGIENFYGYQGQPIMQIGKFNGKAPFFVEVAGEIEDEFFSFNKNIPKDQILTSDSVLKTCWHGNYIEALENSINWSYSTDIVKEIVEKSIDNRVLSRYTAFLALEPSDTISVCESCPDESGGDPEITNYSEDKDGVGLEFLSETGGNGGWSMDNDQAIGIEEIDNSQNNLHAEIYPNPFTDNIFIQLSNTAHYNTGIRITVHNSFGQLIRILLAGDSLVRSNEFNWDGKDQNGKTVSNGYYFIVIETLETKKVFKVTKM